MALVAALALSLLVGLAAAPAQAQRTVSIQPPSTTAALSTTFTLTVNVDDATGVAGFQFDISYNGGLMTFVPPPRAGALLVGKGWSVLASQMNSNLLRVLGYSPSATELTGGSGSLVELDFHAIAVGATPVAFQSLLLANGLGNPIAAVGAGGSVTVATGVVANAGPDKVIASGGSTTLEGSASGGVAPYGYSWSPTTGLSDPTAAHPTASPSSTTIYTLTVTDNLGQSDDDTVTVTVAVVERHLYLSDVSGQRGEQVLPLVLIDEAGGVAGFQMDIGFDANSKTLVSVGGGSLLTPEWVVQSTEPSTGVVRILGYSSTATELAAGGGDLVVITFQERADAPQGTTALTFLNALLANGSGSPVAVITHDGSNTVIASHTLSVSASCAPTAVESGGTTSCSATATDSLGHAITSWHWSADTPGGSFSPSADVQTPTYTAAANLTGSDLLITLTAGATCAGGGSASGPTTLTVRPQPVCRVEIAQFRAPQRVWAGTTRDLVVVVRNIGTVATDVRVQVERIAPSPGAVPGSPQTVHLGVGKRARVPFSYTFTAGDAPLATFRATATPLTPGGEGDTAEDSTRVEVRRPR